MADRTTDAAADSLVRIRSDMTIQLAAGLRETLADAAAGLPAGSSCLRLDLSAVHEFDSSGVQLLLAARRSLAERGATLQVVATASAVRDALQLFGLSALLAPMAEAA
jgi:anti-anti-sigma factor